MEEPKELKVVGKPFTKENASKMAKRSHQARRENRIKAVEEGLDMSLTPEQIAQANGQPLKYAYAALWKIVMRGEGNASVNALKTLEKSMEISPEAAQTVQEGQVKLEALIPIDKLKDMLGKKD